MLSAVFSAVTRSVASLLPQPLLGAAPAPLLLPTDFVALLIVRGFRSAKLALYTLSQEAPGQEAVEPL
jgi:hypothetical protein